MFPTSSKKWEIPSDVFQVFNKNVDLRQTPVELQSNKLSSLAITYFQLLSEQSFPSVWVPALQ